MPDPQDQATPAENIEAVEDNSPNTSPVDETNTSVDQETDGDAEQAQAEPAAEETDSEPERKPSRAERKIRELNGKVKQLEQENQQFQSFGQPPVAAVNPGEELTMEQYQQHVAQAAQNIASQTVQQQIAQERAKNNFDSDQTVLPTQFTELDSNSDDYLPEVENAISQEFQEKAFRAIGINQVTGQPVYELNPSVRLADIAKRYVDVARAAATKSSAAMKNSVATTADETAVRPSGSASSGKKFEDLSIAEMEAQLGTVRQ